MCRDDEGRVLLCHIAPSVGVGDVWTLPGGGLDFGEPPEAAVLRELDRGDRLRRRARRASSGSATASSATSTAPTGLHAIRILYRVRIIGGELRDEPDGSTDTCRWVKPEEARKLRLGELARRALDLVRAEAAR